MMEHSHPASGMWDETASGYMNSTGSFIPYSCFESYDFILQGNR
jgi:hypothetical protein